MACLSPLDRTDLPRSPSPSARPLTLSPLAGVASIMDVSETEGKGWEISFDTDTEDEEEDLDFTMDVPCRDSKDSHGPDGAEYK
jgi:hypothetical protein